MIQPLIHSSAPYKPTKCDTKGGNRRFLKLQIHANRFCAGGDGGVAGDLS